MKVLAVPALLSTYQDALLWAPALLVIVATNLILALLARPLGAGRWLAFFCVASAPAWTPAHGTYSPSELGLLNTIITSLAIVSAARLPDWDQAALRTKVSRWTLFMWMSLPVVSLTNSRLTRRLQLRAGLLCLGKALLKRLAWLACAQASDQLQVLPWFFKSALLILYFVLNLTAFHDLVAGLCHLMGLGVDELFDSPLLSRSPRDFWSRRWNKFISRFALKHVALKVRHRSSPLTTILLVFLVSGVFHEYFSWGVAGLSRAPGSMLLFFTIQAAAVWAGSRWPLSGPIWITQPLTFLWMTLTAPLFFIEVSPALLDFTYPIKWLPFGEEQFWGWIRHFPTPYGPR